MAATDAGTEGVFVTDHLSIETGPASIHGEHESGFVLGCLLGTKTGGLVAS